MTSPTETQTQQKEHSPKPVILKQWCIILVCLLIPLSIGILAKYHPANSINLSPDLEYTLPKKGTQAQVNQALARNNDKLATTPSIWPTYGAITSGFGWRSFPLGEGSELHPGIDIANNIGTPVVATADGKVVQSGWSDGYGNMVQVDHGNGIATIYGHNSQLSVTVGQEVQKGQIICYSGSTGKSTGPHVHYEVRVNGTAVDPIRFLVLY